MQRSLRGDGELPMTAGTLGQASPGRFALDFPGIKATTVGAYPSTAPNRLLQIGPTGPFSGYICFSSSTVMIRLLSLRQRIIAL